MGSCLLRRTRGSGARSTAREPFGSAGRSNVLVTTIASPPTSERAPSLRLRQGLVLLLGAVLFAVLVGPEPDRFYLTPLGLGLVYLAAAAAGGRRGGYWATALVLVAWGLAVVWVRESRPDLDTAGVYMTAVGLGAILGLALARRRIAVDAMGLAGTIVLAGLSLAFASQWEALVETRTYAIAVGVVGLVNVVAGAVASRQAPGDVRT
jgi:hypothetical protein